MEIEISALSYAYSVLKSASASDAQKLCVAALYNYYKAAIAYRNPKLAGWQTDDFGNTFYYNTDGTMATGWKYDIPGWEGKWFYFGTDGIMATGWQSIGEYWYYFSPNGIMYTDTYTPDGYYVDKDGHRVP